MTQVDTVKDQCIINQELLRRWKEIFFTRNIYSSLKTKNEFWRLFFLSFNRERAQKCELFKECKKDRMLSFCARRIVEFDEMDDKVLNQMKQYSRDNTTWLFLPMIDLRNNFALLNATMKGRKHFAQQMAKKLARTERMRLKREEKLLKVYQTIPKKKRKKLSGSEGINRRLIKRCLRQRPIPLIGK